MLKGRDNHCFSQLDPVGASRAVGGIGVAVLTDPEPDISPELQPPAHSQDTPTATALYHL